ncbi:MAG: tRNA pseudouridine(38-40) synthase TruA [Lachnospiraceae bacterium]|nr:tRNA pseudouridine(38-40) synthase TruA [Lachnospiraceae bacterium]
MIKNYKLTIAYDGTRFYGWEHQPDQEWTIQGKLENVLTEMTGSPVEVLGAGRTDAGVHARGMTACARMDTPMTDEQIRDYMNRYLPDDICVKDVRTCADRFHARYNVRGKTYRYTCYVGALKPLFDRKYVWTLNETPDVEKMRRAAAHLMGEHDFASFCGNPRMKKSTVRIVDSIEIVQKGGYLTLTYHGTGFLQYMVRILTGTLIEVGLGKRDPDSIPALLEARDRRLAGPTAPAQGLCLLQVDYN